MWAMSLYLKYRPQDFKGVVGQDHIVTTLKNALKHDALTHAYLFSGPRGTGKTSLARILARSLNCTNLEEGFEPCNNCENCQAILNARLVDLIEIDAASNRGIDEIRELRDKILFAPTQGKVKVYIIDEVHMLTKEAFNALLKTLEEPPSHAYFILATTEVHKIPETIISRCQQFNFRQITENDVVGRLEFIAKSENIQAEPDALSLIAKTSGGSLRDAIGLLEQMNMEGSVIYQEIISRLGITGHMLIEEFFQAITGKDAGKAIEIINKINGEGQNLDQFLKEWIAYLREQMLLGLNERKSVDEIISYIDIFTEAKQQLNKALIPQLPLEIAIIKACGYEVNASSAAPHKAEVPKVEIKEVQVKQSVKEAAEEKVEPISDLPPQGQEFEKLSEEKTEPASELTLENIKQKWQQVLNNIETPFIRMSFAGGEPVKLEGDDLCMSFKSSTLMDKVVSPTNQKEIMRAFEAVFGVKINLKAEVKKITLKPVTEVAKEETKKTENKPSVIDMAQEVFG
jgi:DNA polymerase-3 subunit gamma/tau